MLWGNSLPPNDVSLPFVYKVEQLVSAVRKKTLNFLVDLALTGAVIMAVLIG